MDQRTCVHIGKKWKYVFCANIHIIQGIVFTGKEMEISRNCSLGKKWKYVFCTNLIHIIQGIEFTGKEMEICALCQLHTHNSRNLCLQYNTGKEWKFMLF